MLARRRATHCRRPSTQRRPSKRDDAKGGKDRNGKWARAIRTFYAVCDASRMIGNARAAKNGRVDICRTGSYGPKREAGRLHEGSHWGWQALVRTGCAIVASSYPRPFKTATPSGGYKFAIISLAASPYHCQRKVAAAPAQKGIKKRARMKN
jgi:hypothetical protein